MSAKATELQQSPTTQEGLIASGLDYDVIPASLFLAQDYQTPIEGWVANVRQDTGAVLGVVGSRYQVLQNRDAFSFFDPLLADKRAELETAGCLGIGEKVWILARLINGEQEISKDDVVKPFVVLSNSHDGSTTIQARLTATRVVCANTLLQAVKGSNAFMDIRHT